MTHAEAIALEMGAPVRITPAHDEAPAWSSTVVAVRADGSQVAVYVDPASRYMPKDGYWWVNSSQVHATS
jgi:hypothetical protein